MIYTGDHITDMILDTLSVDVLKKAIQIKLSTTAPKPMTEDEALARQYRSELINKGILKMPKFI